MTPRIFRGISDAFAPFVQFQQQQELLRQQQLGFSPSPTSTTTATLCPSPQGTAPCDEFRAICSYGITLGAPAGVDQYSAKAGANTLFAFLMTFCFI